MADNVEYLDTLPITNDEHARALKELVTERALANRKADRDVAQARAFAIIAEEEEKAAAVANAKKKAVDVEIKKPAPAQTTNPKK